MNVPLRVPCRAGIRLEVRRVEHREPGAEVGQLRGKRADEHVAHEQRMPGVGRDEPHRDPIRQVGPAEQVLHVQLAGVQVAAHVLVQAVERLGIESRVLLPPDAVGRAGLLDDELVPGRAARVGGRHGRKGPTVGELSFTAAERVFQQCGGRQVGVNADRKEAMLDEGEALARDCTGLGVHTLPGRAARVAKDSPRRMRARSGGELSASGAPETTGMEVSACRVPGWPTCRSASTPGLEPPTHRRALGAVGYRKRAIGRTGDRAIGDEGPHSSSGEASFGGFDARTEAQEPALARPIARSSYRPIALPPPRSAARDRSPPPSPDPARWVRPRSDPRTSDRWALPSGARCPARGRARGWS